MSQAVDQVAAKLERKLGEPDQLTFPEDWTLSASWRRAQEEADAGGPVSAAERVVLLDEGEPHRVLFTIYEGTLRAECDCDGYHYRGWCAHVASCW